VIAWGTYDELEGKEELKAAKIFFDRLDHEHGTPISPLYQPPIGALFDSVSRAVRENEAIFYRIRIEQKTGRHVQYD
jgi:hypothetical protein